MVVFFRVPDAIRQLYMTFKGHAKYGRKEWLEQAKVSEEYFYNDVEDTGTTFRASQLQRIKETVGMPFSINILHSILGQKLAYLVQDKPSMKIISLDGRAKDHAALMDKMKHAVLQQSSARGEVEQAIKDMLITGLGHLMAVPMNMYQGGMFNVGVTHVPFDEVILDVNSKKRDTEDMEGFFIEKSFTLDKVKRLFPDILAELVDEFGRPVDPNSFTTNVWIEGELTEKQKVQTTQWNTEPHVVVREFYEKIFTTMYVVPDPRTGLYRYLFAENLELDQQALLANSVDQIPDIYVKKTLMFGDFVVYNEVLPITKYPLKTFFFEWAGRIYRSKGMVHLTKGMQDAFDKTIHIMILNGMLSNNAGWKAPKGAITEEDRRKWEDYANNPRVLKEYVPVVREGQVFVPEQEQIQPLGNFFPYVLDLLKSSIEYTTGVTPIVQGDIQSAKVEVFSSLQQYQNAAMMRMQLSAQRINETMVDLGQTIVEYITANITPDNYLFFDDKGNLNEMQLAMDIVNDIKSFRYLVTAVPATAMPTQRIAVATELAKIAQSTADPIERSLYTQTAMDLTEIREFDNLREQLDVVKNTQRQLEDLQKAYERLMETSKQMENKYINISLENRILKELMGREKKITETYADFEAKLTIAEELAKQSAKDKEKPKE